MEKLIIQSDVPIPARIGNKVYPFSEMNVNDSFFYPFEVEKETSAQAQKVYMALYRFKLKNKGNAFTTRISKTGVRVWRIT